ncbi:MAG: hypothetical protein QM811_06180 [Pirellulales bacterium]
MLRLARGTFARGTSRPTSPVAAEQLAEILGKLTPERVGPERRAENRYPYPRLIYLTPTAPDGVTPTGPTQAASGKHLSQGGIGFYHQTSLPFRRMIVTLERDDRRWLSLATDLTWCRFTKHGWYESGGRFLEVVPSPFETLRS